MAGRVGVCGLASCCSCTPLSSLHPRALTITAMAQLFLLGCTWVFGLFLFDPVSWVLAYIFSILNCLQGLFLFLLHCLLNKKVGFIQAKLWVGWYLPLPRGCPSPDLVSWALQVREEYRKWAGMVTGNKYSEFTTSTSGSSHNQTRVRTDPHGGWGCLTKRQPGLGPALTGFLSPGPQAFRVWHVTTPFWSGQQLLWLQQLLHMLKTVRSSPTALLPQSSCPQVHLRNRGS